MTRRLTFRLNWIWLLLLAASQAGAQPATVVLTNAADVISLSAEQASRSLKVLITGVVTSADPALKGRFFFQDKTAGVFVDNVGGVRPDPGDLIEVTGITHPGAFAPIVTAPHVRKIGTAPLPPAQPVTGERLASGVEDSQRIEISGQVRDAHVDGTRLVAEIISDGFRFRVFSPAPPGIDPLALVATQVRVRGTAAESHNRTQRQLIVPEIYVPQPGDFIVEKTGRVNPFDEPVVALDTVGQYRRDSPVNARIHVRGVVTLQRRGENIFLQDGSGGLQVESRQLTVFAPGDVVEAVGFPGIENYLPVLEDAVLRKMDRPPVAIAPTPATVQEIQRGLHHAGFISLTGRLLNRTMRQVLGRQGSPTGKRITLVLQSDNFIFTAEVNEPAEEQWINSIPLGSTVDVSGVCVAEIDSDGVVKSFRLLIGQPDTIRVIQKPSWWTPARLLIVLAGVCLVLIVAVSWTVMVSTKNRALKIMVREKEQAQLELQRAHNELEDRVKERTAQLKFQITARNESQLQFKAVLNERTRLAQELHDTLEQTLTGIALQMDTATKVGTNAPERAEHHLELARHLVTQGHLEVRRSVWDLRNRSREQFNLPGALKAASQQLTDGTSLHIEVIAKGRVRPLPETIEDNLLRIALESLTNILKHAGATRAKIELDYGPHNIYLQIEDNGKGFEAQQCAGPSAGHFGLLGITERARRLRGEATFTSVPGQGTTVCVQIPIEPAMEIPFTEIPDPAIS